MQDLVSMRWTRMAGVAGSMALGAGVFTLVGAGWTAWMGLAWLGVVLAGVVWLATRPLPSVAQMIGDIELEPARARAPRGPRGRML
jgi:hypothetical protein